MLTHARWILVLPLLAACASDRPSSAPPGSWLAVVDEDDATLRILEPNTGDLKDAVVAGVGPRECAASPDGELVVVSDYGGATPGHTLIVFSLADRRIRDTIDLGEHTRPHGILFLTRRHVLVTSETTHSVLEVDLTRNAIVRRFDTGTESAHMLAVTPDRSRLFTANLRSNSISAIDLASGLLRTVATGDQPETIDVSPDGDELWVGHGVDGKLVVLDTHTLEVKAEIPCVGFPIRLRCTRDGNYVVVSCATSGDVALIDRAAKEEIARIACPRLERPDPEAAPGVVPSNPVPRGILIESRGRYAYVALHAADQVGVIDIEKRACVRTFRTGRGPGGVAWAWRRGTFTFQGDVDRF